MRPDSFRIGDMTIHRIVESEAPFMDAMEFLPDLTPEVLDEHRSWLEPAALEPATGKLIFCFQSYLVRTPHHVVLINSCVGNDKNRPTRPNWHMKTDQTYMSALASAGIAVEDIDYVMCTHLHPDHVGWNTRLENGRWVPTFPNARYVFSDRELAYWTERNASSTVFCRSSRQIGQSWSAAIMPSTIMSDCCRRPGIRPTISPCSSASPVLAPS